MIEKYGSKKDKNLKYKEHSAIKKFFEERMQLPFFDTVERARRYISFYGIYQANDKIELADLKSNHLRQEIMKLKNQMHSYDKKLGENLKKYEEQSDEKRNDLLQKVNNSK